MIGKKGRYKWIIAFLIVVVITTFLVYNEIVKSKEKGPASWFETRGSEVELNITKATSEMAYLDDSGLQYFLENVSTGFFLEGFYDGYAFKDRYSSEGITFIEITPKLKPNNGIMEVFMIEKLDDGLEKGIIYAFVDEDFKNQNTNAYLIYGKDLNKQKPFNYTRAKEGIYYDSIEDDMDRFYGGFNARQGGALLTNFSLEQMELDNVVATSILIKIT